MMPEPQRRATTSKRLVDAGCVALALALGGSVLAFQVNDGLAELALTALPRSGVQNPVTAVLLNYRAYDTLLELGVLLLALSAVWAMATADVPREGVARGPVLEGLARVATPLLVLLAGYFLWIGSSRPGGAFQAGALLGGAGALLLLAYGPRGRLPPERLTRAGAALGLGIFSAVALAGTYSGQLLEYPEATAGAWILLVETAATLSIGLILSSLFLGGRPARPSGVPPQDPGLERAP